MNRWTRGNWERNYRMWFITQDVFEDAYLVALIYDGIDDVFRVTIDLEEISKTIVYPVRLLSNGYEDASNALMSLYFEVRRKNKSIETEIKNTKEIALKDGSIMHVIEDFKNG